MIACIGLFLWYVTLCTLAKAMWPTSVNSSLLFGGFDSGWASEGA